jgi:hypothetical protein
MFKRAVVACALGVAGYVAGVSLGAGGNLADVLLSMGYGKVYVYKRSFARIRDYKSSEETAKRLYRGLWAACKPTTSTTTTTTSTTTATTATTTATTMTTHRSGCDASYPTVCIPPPPPDLDCGEVRFTDFRVDWSVSNPARIGSTAITRASAAKRRRCWRPGPKRSPRRDVPH